MIARIKEATRALSEPNQLERRAPNRSADIPKIRETVSAALCAREDKVDDKFREDRGQANADYVKGLRSVNHCAKKLKGPSLFSLPERWSPLPLTLTIGVRRAPRPEPSLIRPQVASLANFQFPPVVSSTVSRERQPASSIPDLIDPFPLFLGQVRPQNFSRPLSFMLSADDPASSYFSLPLVKDSSLVPSPLVIRRSQASYQDQCNFHSSYADPI
jgi:hypothetical protein